MKKILSLVLVLVILISCTALTLSVSAENSASLIRGKCGDDLDFSLNTQTGEIIISGTGEMSFYQFYHSYNAPWDDYKDTIKTVLIDNGVTSICDYAFKKCHNLTSVTIGTNVTSIGKSAFYNCDSLTSINIPESVKTIGWEVFAFCSSLTSINIPNGITNIPLEAFQGCSSLTNITIPNSVTSIGDSAFFSCDSLESITIPSSVTDINRFAFGGWSNIKKVYIDSETISFNLTSLSACGDLIKYADSILLGENVDTVTDFVKNNYNYKGISYENGKEYTVYSKIDYNLISTPKQGTIEDNENHSPSNDDSILSSDNLTKENADTMSTTTGCGSSVLSDIIFVMAAIIGMGLIIKNKER